MREVCQYCILKACSSSKTVDISPKKDFSGVTLEELLSFLVEGWREVKQPLGDHNVNKSLLLQVTWASSSGPFQMLTSSRGKEEIKKMASCVCAKGELSLSRSLFLFYRLTKVYI